MEAAPVGAILHAGCGREPLPVWLSGSQTRLDIDPGCEPDIHASMTELGDIGPYDTVYCSHALEHLYAHDALQALKEFRRVLRDGGTTIIVVPDLEGIKPTFEPVYESPYGPICGFDMIYGEPHLVAGSPFMAHRCGFVEETLSQAFEAAGYSSIRIIRDHDGHNLFGMATK